MTTHQDLIRKFSGETGSVAQEVEPVKRTRSKSVRRRLTMRVDAEVVAGLQILKIAQGIDMNRVCEEAISKMVLERIAKVKAGLAAGEWDVIVRCADASR
jgi:hypothetical protein